MGMRAINLRHKGQITLPSDLREELGLKQGDTLLVERDGRKIVLISADDVEDPTAGIFRDYAYSQDPDVEEEKRWIARHVAETADNDEG